MRNNGIKLSDQSSLWHQLHPPYWYNYCAALSLNVSSNPPKILPVIQSFVVSSAFSLSTWVYLLIVLLNFRRTSTKTYLSMTLGSSLNARLSYESDPTLDSTVSKRFWLSSITQNPSVDGWQAVKLHETKDCLLFPKTCIAHCNTTKKLIHDERLPCDNSSQVTIRSICKKRLFAARDDS